MTSKCTETAHLHLRGGYQADNISGQLRNLPIYREYVFLILFHVPEEKAERWGVKSQELNAQHYVIGYDDESMNLDSF